MVDVSKLTQEQQQQNAVMLLQHYHELCNTNDPSSTFVSPPTIPNIESFFNPPYHHLIVDHLIETELMGIINNQRQRK